MIIVTGAAGFIGQHITRRLASEGHRVLAVVKDGSDDCLSSPNFCAAALASEFLLWLAGRDSLPWSRSDVDAVIHLGAITDTTCLDWPKLLGNNTGFSKSIWDWCAENKVRLVYASSAATYGDGALGFKDDHDMLPRLRPLNPYGWSKHAMDLYAVRRDMDGKAPPTWTALKFFNVYGPGEDHKGRMASMPFQMMNQAMMGGEVRLFKSYEPGVGHGEQSRDFISVDDVARISMTMAMAHGVRSGVYNVGTGKARSFNEAAEAVFEALGKKPKIRYIDMPDNIRSRYQSHTCADNEKMMRYCPTDMLSLERGTAIMVDKHKLNG